MNRCSALGPSKQKLGATETLAWDRSGGSIKIFLDMRDSLTFHFLSLSLFLLLLSVDKERRRVKKKERHWGDGEEMA